MAASSSKLPTKDTHTLSPPPQPHQPPLQAPPIDDVTLRSATHLTRPELLRRRLNRLRHLSKVYRDHYWALMEDLRVQYRHYYWKYGVSPHKEDDNTERDSAAEIGLGLGFCLEGCGETNANGNNGGGSGSGGKLGLGFVENSGCAFVGCKLKAMALTSFCHLHILSDPQQKLYKACNYVIKSAQAGPILCGKPILKSAVPSLCHVHSQKAQKHVSRALKKAGLSVAASTKFAPRFHVIVAECVRQIQAKRRAAQQADDENITIKEEPTG